MSKEKVISIINYIKVNESKFDKFQMTELKWGLQQGLDVSLYCNAAFNKFQMREIRWGLEAKIDVSLYARPEINCRQMKQFRELLEKKKSA